MVVRVFALVLLLLWLLQFEEEAMVAPEAKPAWVLFLLPLVALLLPLLLLGRGQLDDPLLWWFLAPLRAWRGAWLAGVPVARDRAAREGYQELLAVPPSVLRAAPVRDVSCRMLVVAPPLRRAPLVLVFARLTALVLRLLAVELRRLKQAVRRVVVLLVWPLVRAVAAPLALVAEALYEPRL